MMHRGDPNEIRPVRVHLSDNGAHLRYQRFSRKLCSTLHTQVSQLLCQIVAGAVAF